MTAIDPDLMALTRRIAAQGAADLTEEELHAWAQKLAKSICTNAEEAVYVRDGTGYGHVIEAPEDAVRQWCYDNPALRREYAGRYIALDGVCLVEHGGGLLELFRKLNDRDPKYVDSLIVARLG